MPATTNQRLERISIAKETKLIDALRLMDQQQVKLLLVMDGHVFRSLVSIGDIQRAIVRQVPLDSPVEKVLRKNIRVAHEQEPFALIKQRMLELRTEMMPVVNQRGDLVRVYFWDVVFVEPHAQTSEPLPTPVVIMAGGLWSASLAPSKPRPSGFNIQVCLSTTPPVKRCPGWVFKRSDMDLVFPTRTSRVMQNRCRNWMKCCAIIKDETSP